MLRRLAASGSGGDASGAVARPGTLPPAWNLLVGACEGSTAAIFTTPFDLVKTRLQTESAYLAANPAAASGGVRYRGVAHVLSTIVREEGIRGLYRGIGPRLVIYCSQGAIFFGCYELCKALFEANAATLAAPNAPAPAAKR